MGKISGEHADLVIITSDNPRSEDPEAIVKDVLEGVKGTRVESVVSRRGAILRAIDLAREGDVVLVAGKGHETYQEIQGVRHHFDDREEVLNAAGAA
jgi:UDP-N-acetylmuramoyl-L-alanyl-D-glutamate--2,6-diaminopimelate ligase